MVGVAGRSRGCKTCKARKVKCDEAKPTCERCRKAYMVCGGYSKPTTIFIYSNGNATEDPGVKSPRAASTSQTNSPSIEHKTCDPAGNSQPRRGTSVTAAIGYHSQTASTNGPTESLGCGISQTNIWISFATVKLFPGAGYDGVPLAKSWLLDLLNKDESKATLSAVCGISAALMPFTSSDARRRNHIIAASYYGIALKQLAESLQHVQKWYNPTNVGIAFLLSIYELATYPNGLGWRRHAQGIGKLIEMRGPKAHQTEPARRYLEISRLPILIVYLAERKSCFLENTDWRATTMHSHNDPGWSMCVLLDIFATIPGLLELSDILGISKGAVDRDSIRDFKRHVIKTITELFDWRANFEIQFPRSSFEHAIDSKTSITLDENDIPLFSTVLFYKHLMTGRQVLLYNTLLLLMFQLASIWKISDVAPKAFQALPSTLQKRLDTMCPEWLKRGSPCANRSGLTILPHRTISTDQILTEVCRSFEYFLQPQHILKGTLVLMLPFRVLKKFLLDERLKTWIARLSDLMANASGFLCASQLHEDTKFLECNETV